MMDSVLKTEEKIICTLRSVYHRYGYAPYAMSKFEDYEFYIQNKDFLVSDRVIAFNDTNGKMLALKPDVTLSIIKSGKDCADTKQKVYYDEHVYRVSKTTHRYKEILQVGLECIGDIDDYDVFEVVSLAAESLSRISGDFSLVISHLGILSDILNAASGSPAFRKEAIRHIAQKNTHDLQKLCAAHGVSEEQTRAVLALSQIYGSRESVIGRIAAFADAKQLAELQKLSDFLSASPYSDKIQFDFSVVDDMNYYNGFLFKGYVDGIASELLSAARIAGVDRIFKVGGAQAIAALAYGTDSVPRVHKIVGPGNAFVAEAKKQVFGRVSIDMIAGPSEILVLADSTADPEFVAADLLSQAEHDKNASAVLVTDSMALARATQAELERQLPLLPREEIARASIDGNGKIIVSENDLSKAVDIANEIAPEHLELCVDDPFSYLDRIKNAGSIFMGKNCPEALGDYFAGPNHTLPTSGTAKFSSPLSVDDFVKKSQFIYYTRDALGRVADKIDRFAQKEGLHAHGKSVTVRFCK